MARRTHRRLAVLPNVLVGLGVALLVLALLLPTYVAGKLITTPLDTRATTVASSTATILNRASLQTDTATVDSDVPVTITRTVSVVDPVSAESLTFQAAQIVERGDAEGEEAVVDASIDRVTVDRVSGSADGQPEGSIDLAGAVEGQQDPPAEAVTHSGLAYKFPFDTQQQTYEFFDVTTRTAWPAEFQGTEELNGETVYRFQQQIPDTDLSTVTDDPRNVLMPMASQVGVSGDGPVEVHRFYSNTRDLFVDPASGVIVNGQEQVSQYYAQAAGDPLVTAFAVDAGFNDDTVTRQQQIAAEAGGLITLVTRTLPLVAAILGVLLIAAGVVLLRRGGRGRRRRTSTTPTPPPPPAAEEGTTDWLYETDPQRPVSDYDVQRGT